MLANKAGTIVDSDYLPLNANIHESSSYRAVGAYYNTNDRLCPPEGERIGRNVSSTDRQQRRVNHRQCYFPHWRHQQPEVKNQPLNVYYLEGFSPDGRCLTGDRKITLKTTSQPAACR